MVARALAGGAQFGNFLLPFTIVQMRKLPSSNMTADRRQRVPLAFPKTSLAFVESHFGQFVARAASPGLVLYEHTDFEESPDVT